LRPGAGYSVSTFSFWAFFNFRKISEKEKSEKSLPTDNIFRLANQLEKAEHVRDVYTIYRAYGSSEV